ncbi:FtsB family cell division protein [Bacillus horti]|uniref:Cell division protein DivIC n=1 Tax=Caldalkalibacillus horti TaxID=77523 RepID=A0ABT9W2X9_9BACI|nr:septum formation initiator family protein [Bacillus horti]MDQ0167592.1 cell division protein DivIC [Bacillus horti]
MQNQAPYSTHNYPSSSGPIKKTKPNPDEVEIKRKRSKRLKWFGAFMLLFFIWAGTTYMDQKSAIEEKRTELEAIQQKVAQINEEQSELLYQVKRLNDHDYIAEIARKDYFLSRPGEVIFRIPEK